MTVYLVLSIALLFPTQTPSQTDPAAPGCMIRMSNEGRVTQLVGVLMGAEPASGSYRLIVLKQGASGTSRTVQDGSFTARTVGTETLLGAVAIRLSAGDALSAELTIRTGDTVVCTATL
jgi:hypothetical protein